MAACPIAVAGGFAIAVLSVATGAKAAEWYLNGRAAQEFSYDDNIGLRSAEDQKVSAFGETSSIGFRAGGRSPTVDVGVDALFDFTRFPDESSLNSNDQFLSLDATHTGERLTAQLAGQYVRDTTRTSDIEDSGLFILQNRRREVRRLTPSVSYQLTPVDEVSFNGELSDTYYPSGNVRNFQQWGGSGDWARSVSERTQLLASLSGFQVNSNDAGSQDTTYYSASFGVGYVFSPTLRARLLAGPTLARVNFVFDDGGLRASNTGTTVGYGFDGTVDYRYQERLSFQGRVYRTVQPSSTTGVVSEETGVRLSARYGLLEHVSADLAALYILRESVGQSTSGRRDFVSVQPALRWQFAEEWDLRVSYRFRWQKFEDTVEDPDASSNAVLASITYRLPPLAMSR